MPTNPNNLARNLGEFVGHIWQGVKADVNPTRAPNENTNDAPADVVRDALGATRQETIEREHRDGKVILRRTIVEEIEVRGSGEWTMGNGEGITRPTTNAESRMPNPEP
jgi:hypothetical protein